jgi:large subunit ribosomal protein L24
MRKKKIVPEQRTRIRKGDKVVVVAGNSRGVTGSVINVMDGNRILVQGVNVRKKHIKPTQERPKGGIAELERPIHISNVQVCDEAGKPVRLKAKTVKGEKKLYYKREGKEVVYRSAIKHKSE